MAPATQNETGSNSVPPRKPKTGPRGFVAITFPKLLHDKHGTLEAFHFLQMGKVVGIGNTNFVTFTPGNVRQ